MAEVEMHFQPEQKKTQHLKDVKGKEIKLGAIGRLSETGKKDPYLNNFLKTISDEAANLYFKILEINPGDSYPIFAETTELNQNQQMTLKPEWVIIDSY